MMESADKSDVEVVPQIPSQAVSQFTAAININEILIGLGASRAGVIQSERGASMQIGIEWIATLAMSPQAARTLSKILDLTLRQYESQFGNIPADKQLDITMNKA